MIKKIWPYLAIIIVLIAAFVSHATPMVMGATLVGIIFVIGVAYKQWWGNIAGAALALFYGVLSYEAGFFANAAMNLLLLVPMQLFAVYYWKRYDSTTFKLERKTNFMIRALFVVIAAIAAICAFYYDSKMPVYDGVSSILLIFGTAHLTFKLREQWYYWIPYNILECVMWYSVASLAPEMLAILAMRIVFLINSLFGFWEWNKPNGQSNA